MKKTMKRSVLWLTVIALNMALIACSADSERTDDTNSDCYAAESLIDSIGFIPTDPATFKFYYDQEGRVTKYRMNTAYSNTVLGSDTVTFDYKDGAIVMQMRLLKFAFNGYAPYKEPSTGTFYLRNGLISCSVILNTGTHYKDSVVYQYDQGRLASFKAYRTHIDLATKYDLNYVMQTKWTGGNLTGMTGLDGNGDLTYEVTYTYGEHPLRALLPYLTFDYMLDNDKTYISVLANMGLFGKLPEKELLATNIVCPQRRLRYEGKFVFQYDTQGLPLMYEVYQDTWYKGTHYDEATQETIELPEEKTSSRHDYWFNIKWK